MFVEGDFQLQAEEPHLREMRRFAAKREEEHDLWGFKEPRVSLFLEDWKRVLPGIKVLVVYRHFEEATRSLAGRHAGEIFAGRGSSFDRRLWDEPDLALKSWLAYNQALLAFVRAHPEDTITISFDTLRSGLPLVRIINRRWNLSLEEVAAEEVLDPATPIEPPGKQRVSDRGLIPQIVETWEALEELDDSARRESGTAPERKRLVSEEDFYTPPDGPLAAENELLSFHVRFLEERLARNEEIQERLRTRLEKSEERSRRARRDLQALLRSLSRAPLGPALRLKKSFRELEDRYLKDE